MPITIKEVVEKKDFNTFIYLPEKTHQSHQNWVHPLYIDELKFFNSSQNPSFAHNKTVLFLAYKGKEAVGRIMGIIPLEFNKLQNVQTARFCYFESIDDENVFKALIEAIEKWAKENGANEMIGPMGFSDKEPQGFLIEGFDELQMPVTNHSFSYMKHFIEKAGYNQHLRLYQYDVPINNEIIAKYEVFTQRALSQHQIKIWEFQHLKDIKPFVKPVFNLINSTYTDIYGFTKVTTQEAEDFANRFLPLLNPKLIKIITNKDNNIIAFVIAMPNVNEGIQKAKGRLFPLGWFHILRSMRTSKRLVLLLGAVDNNMQNKGLDAILAIKLLNSAKELGFKTMDSHLIMEKNLKMRGIIERIQGNRLYKKYAIFNKKI